MISACDDLKLTGMALISRGTSVCVSGSKLSSLGPECRISDCKGVSSRAVETLRNTLLHSPDLVVEELWKAVERNPLVTELHDLL